MILHWLPVEWSVHSEVLGVSFEALKISGSPDLRTIGHRGQCRTAVIQRAMASYMALALLLISSCQVPLRGRKYIQYFPCVNFLHKQLPQGSKMIAEGGKMAHVIVHGRGTGPQDTLSINMWPVIQGSQIFWPAVEAAWANGQPSLLDSVLPSATHLVFDFRQVSSSLCLCKTEEMMPLFLALPWSTF